MNDISARIAENLAKVRQQVAAAAVRAGRKDNSVRLVAVTKYVGVKETRALAAAGCRDLGESRPQDLWDKARQLADLDIHWHLVGHLQRNKIRRTLPVVQWIQSVDNPRLLEAIERIAAEQERSVNALLEVNISGDPSKHGLPVDEVETLLPKLSSLAHVKLHGLMGMASLEGGLDQARVDFRRLRELRDRLVAASPAAANLVELSMGMSGDFEIAIEEGATIVRVGSALFEGLQW